MYKHCYDNNHSYIDFDAKKGNYNKRRRKGIYEKLMCKECEERIQQFEDYAKYILYDKAKEHFKEKHTPFSINTYNYVKFKNFILSIVWRASVSSFYNFEKVSLGQYEDGLRETLLNNIETPVNSFPCIIYQTHTNNKQSDGVFMQMFPSKSKADGKTIYQFIADGLYFFVGIGTVSAHTFKQGSSISPQGLRVGYDELSKIEPFIDVFGRLTNQGKFSVYENIQNK